MMTQQSPRRFRFRFQTMMVIFTAVAIFLGLLLREVQHERRKKQVIEAIKKDGGSAHLEDPMRYGHAPKGYFKDWIRIFLGDDYFSFVPSLWVKSDSSTLEKVAAYFPELRVITIRDVSDGSLNQLSKLSNLNQVSITKGEITDIGLDLLSRIESIEYLMFDECSLKDGSGAPLGRCPRLRSLSFVKCELSNQILNSLQGISRLDGIVFVDCKIDDTQLNLLQGSTSKVHLQLNNCNVTEAGVLSLRKANPNWEVQCFGPSEAKLVGQDKLNIYPRLNEVSGVTGLTFGGSLVTDATLITLAEASELRRLSVTHTALSAISFKGIDALRGLKSLSSLNLNFTHCSDVEVIAIANLSSLEVLSLRGCPITDASVADLVKLKSLKQLIVVETSISESGLGRLRLGLPNCEIVSKFE